MTANVENYSPISILTNLSKVYERCSYIQIYEYLSKIISKRRCGFRQSYSAQHCFLVIVEKWVQCLDNGRVGRALLKDFSKVFDFYFQNLEVKQCILLLLGPTF